MGTTTGPRLAPVIEDAWLRDTGQTYLDRAEAGRELARRLRPHVAQDAIVIAIPCGGVPVGAAVAQELGKPLEVAVVLRLSTPWGTRSGAGAVGFDGRAVFETELLSTLDLAPGQLDNCVAETQREVRARIDRFEAAVGRAPLPARFGPVPPPVSGRDVILVDDELVSPVTVRAAVDALRRQGPRRIVLGVPSGMHSAIQEVRALVDLVVCPILQHGAMKPAFVKSRLVTEEEARHQLGALTFPA